MREEELHIGVLFGYMQPELLRSSILKGRGYYFTMAKERELSISSNYISEEGYLHCARSAMTRRTIDELIQFYRELKQFMQEMPENNVFTVLANYAGKILRFRSGEPFCRQEKVLAWRMQYFRLGQDIFTCAGLAKKDISDFCQSENFSWPAVVRTDSIDLQKLLERGISENHFHLNGSTQLLPLAWSFLMNHPEKVGRYFKNAMFAENLKSSANWGSMDNKMSWPERIYDAAWIRAYLFRKSVLQEEVYDEYVRFTSSLDRAKQVKEIVEMLRFSYGACFQQPGGKKKCLDYAVTRHIAYINDGTNRLLAGERNFLYQCFRRCFSGGFSQLEQDLFYLYLLIKLRFREELIQSNERMGFRNFADYQDRKAHGWGELEEYWTESYRLSVRNTLESSVRSLEMRIMPNDSKQALKDAVKRIDDYIDYEMDAGRKDFSVEKIFERKSRHIDRREEDMPYFYVLHFGKKQLKPTNIDSRRYFLQARNWEVRQKIEIQAKAINCALEDSGYLCARIRGIDACSHEIGCRPETFAVAFRFLTEFCAQKSHRYEKERYWPKLGKTYHAGEDFLELTDGLRAIDEAVCFLNLERGDRLGHALALGVVPEQYYDKSRRFAVLPVQDILDNLVWILYRSLEWGIMIPEGLRFRLHEYAESLLKRIYGKNCPEASLREYYESWTLRGDDPLLYSELENDMCMVENVKSKVERSKLHCVLYNRYMVNHYHWKSLSPDSYREKVSVLKLLYYYHFGVEERVEGARIERFAIDRAYVQLLREVQDCMMQQLMEKGIAIECNPSSNYLIGSIEKYDQHPIFRFNSYGLPVPDGKNEAIQLKVSVNTDDQGVFDTSLQNEYALLYASLQKKIDVDGKRLISNDDARAYLEHIRCIGNEITFSKAVSRVLEEIG